MSKDKGVTIMRQLAELLIPVVKENANKGFKSRKEFAENLPRNIKEKVAEAAGLAKQTYNESEHGDFTVYVAGFAGLIGLGYGGKYGYDQSKGMEESDNIENAAATIAGALVVGVGFTLAGAAAGGLIEVALKYTKTLALASAVSGFGVAAAAYKNKEENEPSQGDSNRSSLASWGNREKDKPSTSGFSSGR